MQENQHESEYEEIDLNTVLEQRFEAGQGVVTLSPSMTDEQILKLVKPACTWSQGKAFQIVPPRTS
ncbi:hypothetical protein CXB38_00275 [Pseudomonas syringae]|uniref:hypothetical protein n=1 Tax=Pseudomonas syringae TaxID=317 RepID=UPI000CDA7776|nr:hypothetical protein [Pseudomonas syringae]POP83765.1 hypothetical protein CXB38_00275 [Pseudomonas syringae]